MGWLYQKHPIRREQIIPELKRGAIEWDAAETKAEVLDAAIVGGAVYAAVRVTFNNDNEESGRKAGSSFVTAFVVLFRNTQRDGFGFKDMSEAMGPSVNDCPKRIMKLLTPIGEWPPGADPSFAEEWRKSVMAKHAQTHIFDAIQPGDKIEFPEPLRFTNGAYKRFEHVQYHRRTNGKVFRPIADDGTAAGGLVRITRGQAEQAECLTV
jgi:hypothetical protein